MNNEPLIHEIEASIGINNEIVEIHCAYVDSLDPPEIHKVMFEGIDIMGCLSWETIDELETSVHRTLLAFYFTEKGESEIDKWETKQLNKGDIT